MTEPFTRTVLARIKQDSTSLPADLIARGLDWPIDRLRRVARAHGIELLGPRLWEPPPERTPVEPRQLAARQVARDTSARLTKPQAMVLQALRRQNGVVCTSMELADRLPERKAPSYIRETIKQLRRKGFTIESNDGVGRGYRLVEGDGAE